MIEVVQHMLYTMCRQTNNASHQVHQMPHETVQQVYVQAKHGGYMNLDISHLGFLEVCTVFDKHHHHWRHQLSRVLCYIEADMANSS